MRTGRPREVVEAEPQNDCAAYSFGPTHPACDAINQSKQHDLDLVSRLQAAPESLLRTDRPAPSTHLHRPRISIVGQRVQLPPHAKAHYRFERGQRHGCNFADTSDTASVQFLRCDSADSPESLDRQRVQKGEFVLWFNYE
jgi:hypothetical protein